VKLVQLVGFITKKIATGIKFRMRYCTHIHSVYLKLELTLSAT